MSTSRTIAESPFCIRSLIRIIKNTAGAAWGADGKNLESTPTKHANLGSPQVSRCEQLAVVNCGKAVGLDPLSMTPREVVDEKELVRAFHAFHCKARATVGKTSLKVAHLIERRRITFQFNLTTSR